MFFKISSLYSHLLTSQDFCNVTLLLRKGHTHCMSSSSKAQIHVIVYAKAVTFYVWHKTAKTLQTPFFTILLRGKEQFPKVTLWSLFCLNTKACFVISRSRYNRISTEKLSKIYEKEIAAIFTSSVHICWKIEWKQFQCNSCCSFKL